MMNRTEALEFAIASARMACNAWEDYGSLERSIACHEDNIVDTLIDAKIPEIIAEALDLYRGHVTARLATITAAMKQATDQATDQAKRIEWSESEEQYLFVEYKILGPWDIKVCSATVDAVEYVLCSMLEEV